MLIPLAQPIIANGSKPCVVVHTFIPGHLATSTVEPVAGWIWGAVVVDVAHVCDPYVESAYAGLDFVNTRTFLALLPVGQIVTYFGSVRTTGVPGWWIGVEVPQDPLPCRVVLVTNVPVPRAVCGPHVDQTMLVV
jgi:hypothetical protein